jgi:hypothetical protein
MFLLTGWCAGAQTNDTHPATGKYNVYRVDAHGGATSAFDFTLIRKSSDSKNGLYELAVGKDAKDKSQSTGEYQYNAATKTITWLSGPFATDDQYKPGPSNANAGRVMVKGSGYVITLSNGYKATNNPQL